MSHNKQFLPSLHNNGKQILALFLKHGATEKFCGRGVLGLGGVLGDCLDKIISCEFKVSIRLLPSIFVSVKPKDLQLDWVKVSNYKGNMFHINDQSTTLL